MGTTEAGKRRRGRWLSRLLTVHGVAGYVFLYLPIIILVVFSFNASRYASGAWRGFSLEWYVSLFSNEAIGAALKNTLIVAGVSTVISTVFGTMVADGKNGLYIGISRKTLHASGSTASDRYLLKFSQTGEHLWERRLGTDNASDPQHLDIDGLASDDRENIYVFGNTRAQRGQQKIGGLDAIVLTFDQAGDTQRVWQFGTAAHDGCGGLAIDADGNLYVAGNTAGSFAGANSLAAAEPFRSARRRPRRCHPRRCGSRASLGRRTRSRRSPGDRNGRPRQSSPGPTDHVPVARR